MFAISFDLDTDILNETCHGNSYMNAYSDIRRILSANGFSWTQGSVYFGDETVDAVRCVLTVQQISKTYDWFEPSVRDIRMLRIEDNNDLMPAVAAVRP